MDRSAVPRDQLVLVGVEHVGAGVRVEVRDDLGQRLRPQFVVVVEERNETPARAIDSAEFEAVEMPAFTDR